MASDFVGAGVNVDFSKNFIRGAARLMIADMTLAFPTEHDDIVRTGTSTQDEIQTVTKTGGPTGGTLTLSFKGYTTTGIAFNASSAAVQSALEALASIGEAGVSVAGSAGGPWTVTFEEQLSGQNVPLLSGSGAGLTGGTTPGVSVVQTTAGFGQYSAQDGWIDLGATKGGVNVLRNNSEEVFTVDQIQAELASQPTAWEQSVSTQVAQIDLEMIQYVWEGGDIEVDAGTGERTMGLGTPECYRQRRLAVGFQRPSFDCGVTEGGIAFFVFRKTQRSAAESTLTLNSSGDQSTLPFTWRCLADTNIQDKYRRFGVIIDAS